MTMEKIRVFVVDDHAMFRQGIISLLESEPSIQVTGEADSPEKLAVSPDLRNTDILLLDLSLENRMSLDSLEPLNKARPDLKVIILTMHNKPVLIKRAVNMGVDGYLLKQSPPAALLHALDWVYHGRKYLDPALSDSLFQCLAEPDRENPGEGRGYALLSRREQEIFRLLAEGLKNDQIARSLFISRKTVENHRFRIMQKLEISSLQDLVAYADEIGVI